MTEEKSSYYLSEGDDMDSINEEIPNVVSEESYRDGFWMTPNIVNDMDISKEAFRVYSHLKSICGEGRSSVWQSTKTISLYCDMGTGTVSRAKEELQNYFIPLIRVETKHKKEGGIYHNITILDIWNINNKYMKNKNIFKFEKVEKYKELKEAKRSKKERSSTVERGVEGRSSTVETNNTTINNTPYIPAIAGEQFCENCKEDKMCDKCEMLKKKIEMGTEYGFKFDVKNSKVMLANLEESHKTEDPTNRPKETQAERISVMMQGSKDEYADRLADYPDRCRKPLSYFLHKWSISPNAVPKKSKSKGGAFATWIMGIDELIQISGEKRFELVLDKVYDVWYNKSSDYKWAIDRPQSLKKQFVSCDSELRQSEIKQMKEAVEIAKSQYKEESVEYVNPETAVKSLEEFKKSMRRKH